MTMIRNPCPVLLYKKSLWKVSLYVRTHSCPASCAGWPLKKKKMFCIESSFSTDTKLNCKP